MITKTRVTCITVTWHASKYKVHELHLKKGFGQTSSIMIAVLLIMTVDTDVHKLIVPSLLTLHTRPKNIPVQCRYFIMIPISAQNM